MEFLKRLYRKYVHHEFDYKDFGDVKNLKRYCPYCKQWFYRVDTKTQIWYEPINGIVLDSNCTCHHWKNTKRKD